MTRVATGRVVPRCSRRLRRLPALGRRRRRSRQAAPTPRPAADARGRRAVPDPEPSKIDVGGFVDIYYGYNFNKVDPQLRTFDVQHNTFSLSLAEVNFTKTPTAGEPGRLPHRPLVRQDRRPDGGLRARERRQGDLQAHPAGLRQPAHRQGAVGRRQVRDADGRRGDRVAGQLELHALDPVRLRDPVLPRGCCGPTCTVNDKVTLGGYLVNGWNNASEINGDKTVRRRASTLKPTRKLTWVANDMVGKEHRTRGRATTRATSSTPPSPGPPRRSSACMAQLRLRQGGRREVVGRSPPTRSSRRRRRGPSSAATSTSTTRRAAS